MHRFLAMAVFPALTITSGFPQAACGGAVESHEAIVSRVSADIQYFASDELEGRGISTPGIHRAAERIVADYERLGLKPGMPDGSYRQPFLVRLGNVSVSGETHVTLTRDDGVTMSLNRPRDYQPLQRGTNGAATGEVVFVGYGITAPEENYDDYANVDTEGRILLMIRREPQHTRRDGAFQGTETTSHSYIDTKLKLATDHKAAGVIFVNDLSTTSQSNRDDLTPPSGFGGTEAGIPFIHVSQAVVTRLLQASPLTAGDGTTRLASLTDVAHYIDNTLQPVSQPLTGWTADVCTEFESESVTANNLIGIVEGSGPLADETIIVGGHYDHLGYGGFGSRAAHRKGEIHNGADDNATGTAAVLEMARRISTGPAPHRRIVFICFSAEERGLLGSKHYVQHPAVPLESTVAMLNFDMIGTLRDNRVEVNGVGTAAEFRRIVQEADAASPLDIRIVDSAFAGSDHLPFYQKDIPVMFCFTGLTDRYHTPDDDFNTIDVNGVVSVIDYSELLLRSIDALPEAPEFKGSSRGRRKQKVPVLGIRPSRSGERDGEGVLVEAVTSGTGAAAAGLRVGDLIIAIDDTRIKAFKDLTDSLGRSLNGQTVQVALRRGGENLVLPVVLGGP